MSLSVVDLKRKNWHSKACSKLQCLPVFSRVFSSLRFLRKQEREGKNRETTAVEIPDDLLEEILHRLAVKSLVRMKSVSKGWKSLIESEHLAEKQVRLRQKKYGVEEMKISFEWSVPSSNFRIKYISKYSSSRLNRESSSSSSSTESFLRVAGICNGLVCLYDLTYVYIVNPKTRMHRILDPPQGGSKLSVGFGRDVVTGTYKVVIVYGFDYDDRVETIVFELGTSSSSMWRWRHKTAGPMPLSFTPFTLVNPKRNPVFVNNSLFWLLTRDHSEILVMDLHTEKLRTFSQPQDITTSTHDVSLYMWSLKDRLCVSELRQGLDSDVWVLVVNERWERSKFAPINAPIPPLELNSAWFSHSLVSPYQSRYRKTTPAPQLNQVMCFI